MMRRGLAKAPSKLEDILYWMGGLEAMVANRNALRHSRCGRSARRVDTLRVRKSLAINGVAQFSHSK